MANKVDNLNDDKLKGLQLKAKIAYIKDYYIEPTDAEIKHVIQSNEPELQIALLGRKDITLSDDDIAVFTESLNFKVRVAAFNRGDFNPTEKMIEKGLASNLVDVKQKYKELVEKRDKKLKAKATVSI